MSIQYTQPLAFIKYIQDGKVEALEPQPDVMSTYSELAAYSGRSLIFQRDNLSGAICLKHSATLILPPLSKPNSRHTCLIIISKLFFTALPIPSFRCCVCVCVCACVRACVRACVCVVSEIVKRPVLPPCVVDGRSRNPLYYYDYFWRYMQSWG